jgi:23S rRNA (pseudouridine1915-N3)-methyltransferase
MKLRILSAGHRMPGWVTAGFEEYSKRMPPEARIELVEIKPEKRVAGKTAAMVMAAEADRFRAAMSKDAFKIMLDERGQGLSTLALADRMKTWLSGGRDVMFVIGGADGLDDSIKREADLLWSLTPLTLPHGLVRVLLAEQLYRAMSVIKGHPYHRE